MPGQYSSVTIVGPAGRRSLALPSDVPVAELLPPLLDRGLGEGADTAEASWALATIDGRTVRGSQTLTDIAVSDGDVLHLTDITSAVLPEPVEDVRDSVEDYVEETGRRWRAGTGRLYATLTAAVAVVAAAFVSGTDPAVFLTGGLVCLSAVVVTWWSADAAPLLARLSLAAGALWAWRITHLATEAVTADGFAGEAMRHTYGAWAAVALMLVALIGTPLALPYVIGLTVVAGVATPFSVALQLGAPAPATIAVTATALTFLIGLLPRVAMAVGGLLGLDRDVQAGTAEVREPELAVLLERLDAMLIGAIIAVATLLTLGTGALLLQETLWTGLLALGLGLALLTRSRVFDQARHVAPFRIGGTVAVSLCAAGWLIHNAALLPWAPAFVVLAALSYVGLASIPRSTVANATAARIIRFAELLLVAACIALCGQITGLYGSVGW